MSPDLNDADLERELRRRANAANVDERWAAGTLLPAVRAAISADVPERKPAPRVAGLAGLATVLAVVVMVILVVPRVIPGPAVSPSAVSGLTDPSPSGPSPTNVPIAGTPAPSPSSRVDCPYAGQSGGPLQSPSKTLSGWSWVA